MCGYLWPIVLSSGIWGEGKEKFKLVWAASRKSQDESAQDRVELVEIQGGDLGVKEDDINEARGGPQNVTYC